ncbi:PIN domain-containing protein [Methanosarcina sp. KYL-1]|uniref:PINc/VapC family ATPase n=1 Tax=Methanosarcina sp. KYL-1 TaxID=2602068 RepID=UPI002101AFF5|nr:PINc/VapC family ATPase [Methanosarcina sp. KYL-1]MCQ1535412.1 PIN domain-containing protein [Methanosarcina sp. KYL-1]
MADEKRTWRIVPDTSVIIDGRLSSRIKSGEFRGAEVIIPEAVVSELEAQANKGKDIGFKGLDELSELRKLADREEIVLKFSGVQPTIEEIKLSKEGRVDALIRSTALEVGGLFLTEDRVQSIIAGAKGLDVEYVPPKVVDPSELGPLKIEHFFADDTMSVHLKNGVSPMAKRGPVGMVRYVRIRDEPITYPELSRISKELLERARVDPESFIEMSSDGATVLQIRNMRIAITHQPFSDDMEITAVRPTVIVDLEQYRLSDKLKERIVSQRGILIAGPPGAGKSTFAAGVARYLNERGQVVKTMESPRDLQVPPEITQYSPLNGRMEDTADLLLLVRPDYTIYDEVRKTGDFLIFADMRLAGVGMIGVVHATRAVDAIQRLIGRVELGIIPQVVDTVIFIDKGEVAKVLVLAFTVKVPHGMTEQDLARPVITIADFETGRVEYEIYTYGEQVVVMPIGTAVEGRKPAWKLAEEEIKNVISRYAKGPVEVEVTSDSSAIVKVRDAEMRKVIGKGGNVIDRIESMLGLHIDVRELEHEPSRPPGGRKYGAEAEPPSFKARAAGPEAGIGPSSAHPLIEMNKKHLILGVPELAGKDVEVYVEDEYLFSATVSRHGDVKLRRISDLASEIMEAQERGEIIEIRQI